MKKLIGSILIMLILTQPTTTEYSNKIKTLSIHIFQEYTNREETKLISNEDEDLNNEDEFMTVEDLSDNMDLVTNLIKIKNETMSNIQAKMTKKSQSREIMSEEQIAKFQQFIQLSNQKESDLKSSLQFIECRKDLKPVQSAVLQEKIDYKQMEAEIISIKNSQDNAIECLSSIINSGNSLLQIL